MVRCHRTSRCIPVIRLCIFPILLLFPISSNALEATFTHNPQDSLQNGGNGGPLPASTQQRRQLLELEVKILNSQDPLATLDHVAKTNGLSREELTGMLDQNRRDLDDSGQLEGMLGEMHDTMQSQGAGGATVGSTQRRSVANSSLPRQLLSLMFSIIFSFMKTAYRHVSRHPRQSSLLITILLCAFLAIHNAPRNGIVISTEFFPSFLSSGHTTLLEPPVEYLERYMIASWKKGGNAWRSSLPKPIRVDTSCNKSRKNKRKTTSEQRLVGGVGMTRSINIDASEAVEGEVIVTSHAGGDVANGFSSITMAQTMIRHHCDDDSRKEDSETNASYQREEMECMIESAKSIIDERKFTEFIPGNSRSLKFRSILMSTTTSENKDSEENLTEGGVLAMKSLGNLRRYGVQPLCFSYETDSREDSEENNNELENSQPNHHCCVAFHTTKGGHFDGELQFSINESESGGLVITVILAIPRNGRAPTPRLAEAMSQSMVHSIAQSTLIRTKQRLSRRLQSKVYRARAGSRAVLKRHLQYEQEKAQEEMAAERKRKWKRNNPDAGHYRPSGHRLKSPNNC